MEFLLVTILILVAANVVASVVVARTRVLSMTQRVLQVMLIWLLPVVGAIVCWVFVSSLGSGSKIGGPFDPLYLPADGRAPQDSGDGFCGCSGGGDGGGGGGD